MRWRTGKIRSLDDLVKTYVPELAGYAYGETSIRNLLRMASGVRFTEEYDGKDDLARIFVARQSKRDACRIAVVQRQEADQGERFHYASIETHVLALTLRAATGKDLSAYLSENYGREWARSRTQRGLSRPTVSSGPAAISAPRCAIGDGSASFSPTTGASTIDKSFLAIICWKPPTGIDSRRLLRREKQRPAYGYGYQFWTFPGEHRRFALLGVFGQAIFVDPEQKLVLVQTAAAKNARIGRETMAQELGALWGALVNEYGGR
jgi:CubicO group peptidase (beta-lactamase class C family)